MDKMQVCGTCDLGSIPGESTISKTSTLLGAVFVCDLTEQSGGLFVRNRKPFELFLELANRKSQKVYRSCNERFPGESTQM